MSGVDGRTGGTGEAGRMRGVMVMAAFLAACGVGYQGLSGRQLEPMRRKAERWAGSRPMYHIAAGCGTGSVNRYPVSALQARGLAWAGDGVPPRKTRQMKRSAARAAARRTGGAA